MYCRAAPLEGKPLTDSRDIIQLSQSAAMGHNLSHPGYSRQFIAINPGFSATLQASCPSDFRPTYSMTSVGACKDVGASEIPGPTRN